MRRASRLITVGQPELIHRALFSSQPATTGDNLRHFGLTETEKEDAKSREDKALQGLDFAPRRRKGQAPRYTRGSYEVLGLSDHLKGLPKVTESLWNFREQVHDPDRAPYNEYIESLVDLKRTDPEAFQRLADSVGGVQQGAEPELEPGRPGLVRTSWSRRHILRWESDFILGPATLEAKPLNSRAALRVHLRDLQRETGLSDKALVHVADVCGPERYDARTGFVRIEVSESTDREANRRMCLRTLYNLIEEGKRAHPNPKPHDPFAAWEPVEASRRAAEHEAELRVALGALSDDQLAALESAAAAAGAGGKEKPSPSDVRASLGLTGSPLDFLRVPMQMRRWRAETVGALRKYLDATKDGKAAPQALSDLTKSIVYEIADGVGSRAGLLGIVPQPAADPFAPSSSVQGGQEGQAVGKRAWAAGAGEKGRARERLGKEKAKGAAAGPGPTEP